MKKNGQFPDEIVKIEGTQIVGMELGLLLIDKVKAN
jgi:hypothetical protein